MAEVADRKGIGMAPKHQAQMTLMSEEMSREELSELLHSLVRTPLMRMAKMRTDAHIEILIVDDMEDYDG